MTWYNWLIVILPFAGVLYMAYHTRKYIRSVPDFLAGGRVCGRYLLAETDANKSAEILNRIEQIAKEEIENVRNTIPLVEYDSVLGYEPSIDYVAGKPPLKRPHAHPASRRQFLQRVMARRKMRDLAAHLFEGFRDLTRR